MNRDHVKKLFELAEVVHPTEPWRNSRTVDAWTFLLEGVSPEGALEAMRHHLRSSRFPPKPADIVTFANARAREKSIHPAPPPGLRYAVDYIEGNDS